jgi:hypothetical protein
MSEIYICVAEGWLWGMDVELVSRAMLGVDIHPSKTNSLIFMISVMN